MTIHVQPIQRVRMYEEPNGSFAVDHTGTLADFMDIPIVEGSGQLTITRQTLEVGDVVQRQDDWNQDVLGLKRASLQFDLNLAPTGTAAGDGTTAVHGPVGRILKAIMGGEQLSTGTTISDAAPTAQSFDVTDATSLQPGSAIGWVNSNGEMEVREVREQSGSNVELDKGFSETPSDTDVIYAAATYYLTQSDGDNVTSLQAIVEGLVSLDRWLLLGGQLESWSLNLSPSQDGVIPRMTITLQFANWVYGDDAATDLSVANLANATYSDYSAIALNDGELRFPNSSGTAYSASDTLHVSAVEYTPNLSYTPVTSPSGTQIILHWIRQHSTPALQGSFTLPFEDHSMWNFRDNRVEKAAFFQIGRSAGGSVMLSGPGCQVTDVQRVDDSGIAAQQVSWKSRLDNGKTGGGDLQQTAFRIHLL